MNIKSIVLSLLFATIIATNIPAQSKYTDSLNIELSKPKDDTGTVLILADLGYYYRYQNFDTAMAYSQQALLLAQKIKFLRGESLAYQMVGLISRYKGDYSRALQKFYKSLQISEENNYRNEMALCVMRIGGVFNDLGQHAKAVSFYHKSIQITGSENLVRSNALSWIQLGNAYEKLNQLDSASYYEIKAYNNLNLISDLTADVCRNMGAIEIKNGNRSLALRYFRESLDAAEYLKDYWVASLTYAEIAYMYKDEGRTDSSIYYAKKGLEYAQNASSPKGVLTCSNILAEMFEPTNPVEALRYYKIASKVKEGMFGAGNLQAIQELVAQEDARQQEIATAKAAYQSQLKQYGLLASLGVFLLIAVLLYRNNLNRKKANKLLQQQKTEVEVQKKNAEQALTELQTTQKQLIQSEKMASLGELTAGIAHEIQNPLNFVNNFSEINQELLAEMKDEMSKGNIDDAKEIANDVIANEEKINHHGKRADAIVKGMLLHNSSGSGKKEPTNVNALADEYLRLAYHGLRAKDKSFNATMKTDFDETIGDINIIPQDIGRVILNLITNAFYAVNEKKKATNLKGENYEPTVSINTKKSGDKVLISVSDNGNGIPQKILDKIFQPFFTTKPTGEGTGLGLSLSYDIVKANGGELRVETKIAEGISTAASAQAGTTFIILLPKF